MSGPMFSVCIFCFICATHSPCASHAATQKDSFQLEDVLGNLTYVPVSPSKNVPNPGKLKPYSSLSVLDSAIKNGRMHRLEKRNSDIRSSVNSDKEVDFIKKIFELFGDGETMSLQGFQSLVKHLNTHYEFTSSHQPVIQQVKISEINETDKNNDLVRHNSYIFNSLV